MKNAFWQLAVDESSRHLLGVNTTRGKKEYALTPMGLKTAQAHMCVTMAEATADIAELASFVDDTFEGVPEGQWDAALELLDRTLTRFEQLGFKLNLKKCTFLTPEIKVLGFVCDKDGLRPDPDNVAAMRDWPVPSNLQQVQSFLGTANYYRSWIKGYGAIAKPLTELTKKGAPFLWGQRQQDAISKFANLLLSYPGYNGYH